jgi:sec-independent protein translocase protein TatA
MCLVSRQEGRTAMIGSQDLMVGLAIVLVLFGAKKLPELAASLGKSMKEFKKGVSEAGEEEPVRPAGPPLASEMVAKNCLGCKTPLQPDWSHCPRCGTVVPDGSAPGPQSPALKRDVSPEA